MLFKRPEFFFLNPTHRLDVWATVCPAGGPSSLLHQSRQSHPTSSPSWVQGINGGSGAKQVRVVALTVLHFTFCLALWLVIRSLLGLEVTHGLGPRFIELLVSGKSWYVSDLCIDSLSVNHAQFVLGPGIYVGAEFRNWAASWVGVVGVGYLTPL